MQGSEVTLNDCEENTVFDRLVKKYLKMLYEI